MIQARSKHDIFESYPHDERWRDWWMKQWGTQLELYERLGWKLIPIGVRAKHPLRNQPNYPSRGSEGPFLPKIEALKWVNDDFNIAVVAGESRIVMCDIDSPELFHEEWMKGLVIRTPRGYAIPFKRDRWFRESSIQRLKDEGYDFRGDAQYELVPLSETCMFDNHLNGKIHPSPRDPCVDNHRHDYRVREWITPLTNPILDFRDILMS